MYYAFIMYDLTNNRSSCLQSLFVAFFATQVLVYMYVGLAVKKINITENSLLHNIISLLRSLIIHSCFELVSKI